VTATRAHCEGRNSLSREFINIKFVKNHKLSMSLTEECCIKAKANTSENFTINKLNIK